MASKQKKKEIKKRAKQIEPQKTTKKQILFVVLVGILATLAIYTSRDDHTSFGLLDQPAYANQMPIIKSFRTDRFIEQSFLELNLAIPTESGQVAGVLRDPTDPPPVEDVSALDARIGGEAAVYWRFPEGVEMANLYRRVVGKTDEITLIAEAVTEQMYVDTGLKNGEVYEYAVKAITQVDGKSYESSVVRIATVTPSDKIPPHAPTEVVVVSVAGGLSVTWVHPTDDDAERIDVYRSDRSGERGSLVESVLVGAEAKVIDKTVEVNKTVYYTVVSVDKTGNESTSNFQIPQPGNKKPFTPFAPAVTPEEDEG